MHSNKPSKNTEGSALLVSLIVMGILMMLSVGVSSLLIGTLREGRLLMEKTEAWYAAESGIEQALFAISQNAPGFEANQDETIAETDTKYNYKISATANEIPIKEDYEKIFPEDSYETLHLNESVTIPLFSGTSSEQMIKKFRVDYYLAPELKQQNIVSASGLDILRWKIFGMANSDNQMEVINEFLPVDDGNSPETPTCMGKITDNCYGVAKFYQRGQGGELTLMEEYPIETFLSTHHQNFLVLTNMMNIDLMAGGENERKILANIKYHVINEDGRKNLTLPNIKIAADGFAGGTKQSLDLQVKRDTFLPVFNYALYRTTNAE